MGLFIACPYLLKRLGDSKNADLENVRIKTIFHLFKRNLTHLVIHKDLFSCERISMVLLSLFPPPLKKKAFHLLDFSFILLNLKNQMMLKLA